MKVLFAPTRNILIEPKLTADSKINAKRKAMKKDNFAAKVLVTQISGSAALDARTPGIVKGINPLKINPLGLV